MSLVAVHAQPVAAVTAIWPVPLLDARLINAAGATTTVQLELATSCETVTVFPPIKSVPARTVLPVFAVALNTTVPLPVPLAPDTIDSQLAPLVAFQPQLFGSVTTIDELPPCAGMLNVTALNVTAHAPLALDCVTVTGWPPIVIVPVRVLAPVLAVTLNVTVPLPVPDVVPKLIQPAELDDVQWHPAAADTLITELPAAAPKLALVELSVTAHAVADASCVTANTLPPMLNRPLRSLTPGFAATL